MSESTQTLTLTDFLLARIAEDEDVARSVPEVEPASWAPIWTSLRSGKTSVCDHGPRGSVEMQPARVLAECEAKRRIVESVQAALPRGTSGLGPSVLMRLAAVYADHPDYRDEWRP